MEKPQQGRNLLDLESLTHRIAPRARPRHGQGPRAAGAWLRAAAGEPRPSAVARHNAEKANDLAILRRITDHRPDLSAVLQTPTIPRDLIAPTLPPVVATGGDDQTPTLEQPTVVTVGVD